MDGKINSNRYHCHVVYSLVMLSHSRMWAAFVITVLLIIDAIQHLIKMLIMEKTFYLQVNAAVDIICIYLLVKGYLVYRSMSNNAVTPLNEGQSYE